MTAEEIRGLASNPENFLFRGHRKCITQCISVWYGNASNQDCKALQRVVCLAECISGSALPSLQDIYLKRCKSRAAKIIKDSNHPGNRLFFSLPSGKRFLSMMAKTERLRRSFFPQAKYFAQPIGLCQSRAFIMQVTSPVKDLYTKIASRTSSSSAFPSFSQQLYQEKVCSAVSDVGQRTMQEEERRAVESVKCLIGTRNGGRHCNLS